MAEPVGAAGPSSTAAHVQQSTAQRFCDRGVGAGICAPSGATQPPPSANTYEPMDPKIARQRARSLIDDAKENSNDNRLLLLSEIDEIFRKQRWAVRHAMREDPRFEKIIGGPRSNRGLS